ncbi:MAG TPA: MDR family MFS transporter [Vicinamibacterales bacterium]|nr:MDR family MFS transporter [Vicinamibacterales bacterium]
MTVGLLLGMSLAALEATVVSTAMPTVISTLGGLAHYSWVFAVYLLTSTASVPIWGRLSDLYGRRRLYLTGIVVFLAGSALSGVAATMPQLIVFRGIQGLGAGAVIPLSMTIIGELYSLEERARTQALFSGMWGLASIAGPLVGGYITDALSWRWVFFLNLPFGALAVIVIALAYPVSARPKAAAVDWPGAALLFGGTTTLLIALGGVAESIAGWLIATIVLLGAFLFVERRASDPILPLALFRYPVVSRSLVVVFMTGMAMFGAIAFVPLFVQMVMSGTATEAGQVLTPLFLGWVLMSIAAARLTVRIGYRPVTIAGNALLTTGFLALATIDQNTTRTALFLAVFVLGCGMGLAMLALLLAVQHGVDRSLLGLATSLNQFSRSVGAAIGVAVMGAILARNLAGIPLVAATHGLPSAIMSLDAPARAQFALALGRVFAAGAVMSAIGLAASFALPPVQFAAGVPAAAGGRMLAAEMATVQSGDGPDRESTATAEMSSERTP